MPPRWKRIRDPIHNLIEFDLEDETDEILWNLIQTEPFQRLRRIKQLGFSELVFPGATHTRFAHCLGVMHIAKKLAHVVKIGWNSGSPAFSESLAKEAICAALLHDLGHGPFSHAFETVCSDNDKIKNSFDFRRGKIHEAITLKIIETHSEIKKALGNFDAKKIIRHIEAPESIYGAIVSSQFDADRLDYMQRDPFMTGTKLASFDFSWLVHNLEIGQIPNSTDDAKTSDKRETLVLNPKARFAGEAYLLALFQLYPNIYFHKTTRGFEVIFQALFKKIFELAQNNGEKTLNLPANHPICNFANNPEKLANYLALDDAVIWGSLDLLCASEDTLVSKFSERLLRRKRFKAHDAWDKFRKAALNKYKREQDVLQEQEVEAKRLQFIQKAQSFLDEWYKGERHKNDGNEYILQDKGERDVYKKDGEGAIFIRPYQDGQPEDIGHFSSIISASPEFHYHRLYTPEENCEYGQRAKGAIDDAITKAIESE